MSCAPRWPASCASFWGAAVLADPAFLRRPEYQAFAVLTMCRALYALEHGGIVSKPAAARWAREALPPGWQSLIEQAAAWQPGMEIGRVDEIEELIRYTVKRDKLHTLISPAAAETKSIKS